MTVLVAYLWRRVIDYERHYVKWEWAFGHHGASSVTLKLECGHTKFQKGSAPIPKKAKCIECADRHNANPP